jgi:hypothetical protein
MQTSKRRQNDFAPSWVFAGLFTLVLTACDPMGQTTIGQDYHPGVTLSYSNSTVSVSSASVASGSSVVVTVNLRDTNYNAFISMLPTVMLGASGGTSMGTFSSVINNLDGSYSATFTGVTIGTATTIEASVDGNVLTSASQVTVSGTLTVTSSGDGNETISPNIAQAVNYGATQSFTVTASAGYSLSSTVGGTCAVGSWSGSTYTTGAVTTNCTVTFSSTINTYTVTPSGDGHESITPNTAQAVNYGATQSFTVTPSAGYSLSSTVGGTCAAGSWSGGTYTTAAVTTNCTVTFSSTINTYTVTPSGDGHETITPNTAQTVNYGATQSFTVTASAGYSLSSTVGGTCVAGSWSGSTYTTGAITANCTVTFSSTVNTYTVTPSGDGHETITPNTAQTVNYGATQSFTVTASAGYSLSSTVGGTCAVGSWSGSTYTTGAVTTNCTVMFSAPSLAGASLDGNSINVGSILAFVFKETSGTTLYDISPAANNGTTNATWAFDSSENKEIQNFNVPSEASQIISFTPNSAQWTGLAQLSAYFRVNIYNVIPSDYEHFFEFGASLAPDYLFFRPSQNSFTPSFFNCCGNYSEVASPDSTTSYYNSWHDFTVTYDNTSGASILYIDGTLNASGSLLPGLLAGSVGGFNIFDGDSADFQVSASVVRFWNRVLTSTEASELHSNPMTGVSIP